MHEDAGLKIQRWARMSWGHCLVHLIVMLLVIQPLWEVSQRYHWDLVHLRRMFDWAGTLVRPGEVYAALHRADIDLADDDRDIDDLKVALIRLEKTSVPIGIPPVVPHALDHTAASGETSQPNGHAPTGQLRIGVPGVTPTPVRHQRSPKARFRRTCRALTARGTPGSESRKPAGEARSEAR